jgi:hypothetical protein
MRVEELQLAGVVRMHEHRQHLALEQARADDDRLPLEGLSR